jgi:hypothetical protein
MFIPFHIHQGTGNVTLYFVADEHADGFIAGVYGVHVACHPASKSYAYVSVYVVFVEGQQVFLNGCIMNVCCREIPGISNHDLRSGVLQGFFKNCGGDVRI